ncbi:hypothetical protein BDY19DRAFT_931161, partial [Irpex rosettiformis]
MTIQRLPAGPLHLSDVAQWLRALTLLAFALLFGVPRAREEGGCFHQASGNARMNTWGVQLEKMTYLRTDGGLPRSALGLQNTSIDWLCGDQRSEGWITEY